MCGAAGTYSNEKFGTMDMRIALKSGLIVKTREIPRSWEELCLYSFLLHQASPLHDGGILVDRDQHG